MSFRIALCQLLIGTDKASNLAHAAEMVTAAASKGAQVVVLPECFTCPYDAKTFSSYCEPVLESSPTVQMLASTAKKNRVYLIGGSFPELCEATKSIFNTSLVFDPQGTQIARHRKVHLFDIDVPGRISFKESETLSAGNQITTFDTEFGKFGLAICYDIRFPELAILMAKKGELLSLVS